MGRPRIQGERPITRSVKLYREWWDLASDFGNGNVTEGLRQGLLAAQESSGEGCRKLNPGEIKDIVMDEAISELDGKRTVGYHEALWFAEQCVRSALEQAGVK